MAFLLPAQVEQGASAQVTITECAVETLQLESDKGVHIALRVFAPTGPGHGNVVVASAMGVRQDFYTPFAQWLASQGWRVTTFDYRGMGDSKPNTSHGGLEGFVADLNDWANDYACVVDHAHAAMPTAPLYLLGHSLGAQLPGLLPNAHKVSGLINIAAGSGYWRDNAPQLKRGVLPFWYLIVPLATRLCGYFPGKRLGIIGNVPAGVMLQWRKWCLNPEYSVGAEGEAVRRSYAQVRFPMVALAMADDEMLTLRSVQSLLALYTNAPHVLRSVEPAEVNLRRIGHFGMFKEEQLGRMWPQLQQYLQQFSQGAFA